MAADSPCGTFRGRVVRYVGEDGMFGTRRAHVRGDPTPVLGDAELLKELASNTAAEVQAKRMHPRFTVSLSVTARPGNFSDRARGNAVGRTVDLSQGGCL